MSSATQGVVSANFVTFYSPGTFVPETREQPIAAWDVVTAMEMAHGITERYGATPYAFRFSTRSRGPNDLDSKLSRQSPLYYLGGKIETREEIEARDDPKDEILRSNMRANDIGKVIVNDNSWRFTAAFNEGDVLLDFTPRKRKAS